MNKQEKEHFEFLKKQKPTMEVVEEEIVCIDNVKKLKITYSNGYIEYAAPPPKKITCNDFGDGCRSGIPFNPNNPKTIDFNWGNRRG